MSDWEDGEDLGDEGWGDENEAGGDGGDDWGDGDDDWDGDGDGDFGGGDDVDSSDVNIQIANKFYEAESEIKDNPSLSLEYFKKVLELGKEGESDVNDESRDALFQSKIHLCVLHAKAGNTHELVSQYKEMLVAFPSVSQNDSNKAVDTVLNTLNTCSSLPSDLRSEIFEITTKTLKTMPNKQRMIFDIELRRCNELVASQRYQQASSLVAELMNTCKLADGSDDQKGKGSELMDLYALEMKIAFETGVKAKTKELYKRTKNLTAAVNNPKSFSIIRECWGKMYGDDGNWQKAKEEFFKAFISYQDAGQIKNAKICLVYVVVANMLGGGQTNTFDAREAAVFQNDAELKPVNNLRKAYEKKDVVGFTKALAEFEATSDEWMMGHMDSMITDFHQQFIMKFVKPYRRVRIQFLADALQISVEKCEGYLVQLVLDGVIVARIDQVKGLLDFTQRTGGGDKKYRMLELWSEKIASLTKALDHPDTRAFGIAD